MAIKEAILNPQAMRQLKIFLTKQQLQPKDLLASLRIEALKPEDSSLLSDFESALEKSRVELEDSGSPSKGGPSGDPLQSPTSSPPVHQQTPSSPSSEASSAKKTNKTVHRCLSGEMFECLYDQDNPVIKQPFPPGFTPLHKATILGGPFGSKSGLKRLLNSDVVNERRKKEARV